MHISDLSAGPNNKFARREPMGRPKKAMLTNQSPQSSSSSSTPTIKPPGSASAKAEPGRRGRPMTVKRLNELLVLLGVKDGGNVSKCLKAAILNGHIKLQDPKDDSEGKYGLDQVVTEGKCLMCSKKLTCRVRDVLYQPDYGGHDYEEGEDATFRCDGADGCVGIYVTSMCIGDPMFDSGKFHNHCSFHAKLGYCIGDYREVHCKRCKSHYHPIGEGKCSCGGAARPRIGGLSEGTFVWVPTTRGQRGTWLPETFAYQKVYKY